MAVRLACWLLIALSGLALVGCAAIVTPQSPAATVIPTLETEEENVNLTNNEIVALAQADLAERLDVAVDQIEVREVRAVTWPDASLGCPQPGMIYAQATQQGYLIRLVVNGEMYFYHSGTAHEPFLCEEESVTIEVTPKTDEMVPPPGSEID